MNFISKIRSRAGSGSQKRSKDKEAENVSSKTSWKDLRGEYAFGDISREYLKKRPGAEGLNVALRVQVIRCRNIGKEKKSMGSPVAPTVKRIRSNSTDSGSSNAPNAYVQVLFGGEKKSTSRVRGFNPLYDENCEGKHNITFGLDAKREIEREHGGRHKMGRRRSQSGGQADECIVVQVVDGGGITFSRTHILGECRLPLSLVRMSGIQHGSPRLGMDFRVFHRWFELQPPLETASPTRKSMAAPPGLSFRTWCSSAKRENF